MSERRRRRWWHDLDLPGLLGCALLIFFTYGMFWYYAESVKGAFGPDPSTGNSAGFLGFARD